MDLADQAEQQNQILHNVHLRNARRDTPLAQATGFCLHCEEPLESPRRWCNADCRNDWEKEDR